MRYFLKLAYNGEKFHGWQSQPNASSVQQTLEEALKTVTRFPVPVTGAGRTDAGVHARTMYAHFDIPVPITDKKRFILSLNRLVGKDIAIYDLIEVNDSAHARFDATLRSYKYFITFEKSPFLYPYTWHSPSRLEVDRMNEAASLLLDISDFTSFAKLHSDAVTNICDVSQARWDSISGQEKDAGISLPTDGIVFSISANRFLRNMVRAVVGTLVDVGRGKISIEGFKEIVNLQNRCAAGTSMPPQALFLWDIKYPFLP